MKREKQKLTPFKNYFIVEGELYKLTDEQLSEWKKDWQMEYAEDLWPNSLVEDDNYDEVVLMIIMNAEYIGKVPSFDFVNKDMLAMNQLSIEAEEKESKEYYKKLKNGKK